MNLKIIIWREDARLRWIHTVCYHLYTNLRNADTGGVTGTTSLLLGDRGQSGEEQIRDCRWPRGPVHSWPDCTDDFIVQYKSLNPLSCLCQMCLYKTYQFCISIRCFLKRKNVILT